MTDRRIAVLCDRDEHGHAVIDCAADEGRTAREESELFAAQILAALDQHATETGADQ